MVIASVCYGEAGVCYGEAGVITHKQQATGETLTDVFVFDHLLF